MTEKRKKLALISNDLIGENMAGPGMRYLELARAFSQYFEVTLFTPNKPGIPLDFCKTRVFNPKKMSRDIGAHIDGVDFVMSLNLRPSLLHSLKKKGIRFIADLYDPLAIEALECNKNKNLKFQENIYDFMSRLVQLQIEMADHIVCSSDRQRDFYTGMLLSQRKINPERYGVSDSFTRFLSVLPCGISKENIKESSEQLLEKKFSKIKKTDHIIYWGGGIWNWFDPLSVVKAVESISKKRDDVKLFFLGLKHPNPKVKEMEIAKETVDYCNNHNLTDNFVFFNYDWTPYNERKKYLARADIGISSHFNNLETRLSFRTRVLDYLWAELPIITTEGDSIADLVEKNNLGVVTRYRSSKDIADAIEKILDDKKFYAEVKNNLKNYKRRFEWPSLILSLKDMMEQDLIPKSKLNLKNFLTYSLYFYLAGFKKKFLNRKQ